MEYLLGSFLTLIGVSVLLYANQSFNGTSTRILPQVSQSRSFSMISPYIIMVGKPSENIKTQAIKHFEANSVRILMTEKSAYWIKNNNVYSADIVDGVIVEETTKVVDMMGMNKVQLDEMMFIIEKLTEGTDNDRWNSGNS